ncbi:MAG TPA: IclR family transcriptional regulator [Actinomycetes bacterium]|nr:IclR family transcriptional regulator [Actinomycetes bacterium]
MPVRHTQVVDRVADVLEALADAGRPVSVTELAARLDVHKATASRLLATMAGRGLVRRESSGYRLGPSLARLAATAVAELELVDLARPVLRDLAEQTSEATYLSVPHRGAVLYVEQFTPQRASPVGDWTGRMGPLHCSSSGKVFAAFGALEDLGSALTSPLPVLARRTISDPEDFYRLLPRIRRQGYAVSSDESEDGLTSVAAPVLTPDGQVVAALGIGLPTQRCTPGQVGRLGKAAAAAARLLGNRIGPAHAVVSGSLPD